MLESVMKAPRFELVLGSNADAKSKTVTITVGTIDKKKFTLDFSLACVPLAIAALAAEAGKIAATLPAHTTPNLQGIRTIASTLAMKNDGTVALLLKLETGVELPLEFQQADLSRLRAQIDEAILASDRNRRH